MLYNLLILWTEYRAKRDGNWLRIEERPDRLV